MEWTGFLFLMLALKIPLGALLWLVWWAIRQTPEEEPVPQGDDGGLRVDDPQRPPRPFPPHPRRRGPHGDPAPVAPPRTRTTVARARTPER